MNIAKIINYIQPIQILNYNNENIEVTGISYNSKTLEKGNIFVCLIGEHVDGHNFAMQAQEKGASAIISQKEMPDISIPNIVTLNTQLALAQLANVFYDFPSKKLKVIGVTGTNGKTSSTHLIENIFEEAGLKCGLIGTLGQRFSSVDDYISTNHTTPQAPDLFKALHDMLNNDIRHVVMEVSSHALEQYRVEGCEFNGAALTNLTQDHLDYHITMDNYFFAKSKLFTLLKSNSNKYAVINNDDSYAERFKGVVPQGVKTLTYGIEKESDIMAKNLEFSVYGSKFECSTPFGNKSINLQMAGLFSVYNALCALAVGIGEGIDIDICVKALEKTKSVAGRFEAVIREPLTIVDYAHTPDGLLNALQSAKKIVPENGRLICVFGCGGDRDATKRPKMGSIAEDISDKVIITSDNPRTEDPQQIITDILAGIKSLNSDKIIVEADRKTAIEQAVKIANKNDVIVIAGKGHENYQILKDKTIHFDDREEALKAFNLIKS